MKRKVKMAIQAPSLRPTVVGTHYGVATAHYLATAAAMRILDGGGNAVDAGVTAAMALPMLQPDRVSVAGVARTLNSFAPHGYQPARFNAENTFPAATLGALKGMGRDVDVWPHFPGQNGGVCAVMQHPETGLRHAGANPRREGYAAAW